MPNGGTYCITPGIRARDRNGVEDKARAPRLSTESVPSNAMIANLISSRFLISSEEGGVSFRSSGRSACTFIATAATTHLVRARSFLCHSLEFI